MNSKEKINDLENKISNLEKIIDTRNNRDIIFMCIFGTILIILVTYICVMYYRFKPYKQQLDNLKRNEDNIKTDTVIDGDNNYDDFFNNFFNY